MFPKKSLLTALLFISLFLNVNNSWAHEAPYPAQFTVNIYQAPTAVKALDKAYLIYELYLTNYMQTPMVLTSLKVTNGTKTIYTRDNDKSPLIFQPNSSKIIYMWVPFDKLSDVPHRLANQFMLRGKLDNQQADFPLSIPTVTIDKTPPVIVGAPLRGKNWLAANGLSNTSIHRKAALYFYGRPYMPQRYAIDFIQIGADGKSFSGDIHKNTSYYCYNQDVLAVADGKVARIQDGIPQNIPHASKRAVQMTTKTLPGNYIILDLGNHKFAAYAHLIPGSLKVKVGDHVTRGEAMAKSGNSGNSDEPHLHFQIIDEADFLISNGIPYGFNHFSIIPSKLIYVKEGNGLKIQFLKDPSKAYANQLPLENTLIRFEK